MGNSSSRQNGRRQRRRQRQQQEQEQDDPEQAPAMEVEDDELQSPTNGNQGVSTTTTTTIAITISSTAVENAKAKRQVVTALKSMQKHPTSLSVQKKNIAKLRKYVNSARSQVYMQHIVQQGGVPVVVAAMKQHDHSSTLHNHACRVLSLMARWNGPASIVAVACVLQAMQSHKRNPNVQFNALMALCHWGMNETATTTASSTSQQQQQQSSSSSSSSVLAVQVVEAGALEMIWNTMLHPWHESNPLLQDKALKTLVVLAAVPENRPAFVAVLGWKALTTAMTNHMVKHAKIVVKGLKLMRHIATDHPQAVAKRGLPCVLLSMKMHLQDAAIQRHGCGILLLLASQAQNHALLWQPGGGRDAILAAMQTHATQEDIQKTAIMALQKLPAQSPLSSTDDNATTTSTTTCTTSTLTNILTGRRSTIAPLPTSLSRTRALSSSKTPAAATAAATTTPAIDTGDAINSGIEAMVARLADETTPPNALSNICKAWIKLASDSHTNKLDIAAAKGIPAIVQAMKRNALHQSLQRYACQALTTLATVEQTKRDIVLADGVAAIVQAIHVNSNPNPNTNPTTTPLLLLPESSTTAQNQQNNENDNTAIVASTASDNNNKQNAIINKNSTTNTTKINKKIQYVVVLHAIMALVRVSQRIDNHERIMSFPPTISTMVRAMTVHADQAHIQHKAMVVLLKLISSTRWEQRDIANDPNHPANRYKTTIVLAGGVQAILHAMTQHPKHAHIQRVGCNCLTHLHLQSTSWVVVQAGSLQVVLQAMHGHLYHIGIQMAALRAICEITRYSCHLQHWVLHLNGLSCLIVSLQTHHDNVSLQEMAFSVLLKSTQHRNPQLRQNLVQAGGIKAIMTSMMDFHPAHPAIQQTGFKALYHLTTMPSHNAHHYGAIIFKHGGWKVVRHAQRACPDDPIIKKHAFTLLVKLLLLFFLHWFVWVLYHVL